MIDLAQMPTDDLYFYTPSEAYPLPSLQKSQDRVIITLYPYTILCKPSSNLISVTVDPIVVDTIEESGASSILDDIIVKIEEMADQYRYLPMCDQIYSNISGSVYAMHKHFMTSCKDYDLIVRTVWSSKNEVQKQFG